MATVLQLTTSTPGDRAAGDYLRRRREAAHLTRQDAADRLFPCGPGPNPLAAFIGDFERGMPAKGHDLRRLRTAYAFDPVVYRLIAAGEPVRICRDCACSEQDPCADERGRGCAWVAEDLCSVCWNRAARAKRAARPSAPPLWLLFAVTLAISAGIVALALIGLLP